jgi:hypothetical protein
MERFTDAFKATGGPEMGIGSQIESQLEHLSTRLVDSADGRAMSPVSKLPWKLFDLLQLGTRRGIELTESAVREMNRKSVGSASVLTRGVFETSCLVHYAIHLMECAVQKPNEFDVEKLSSFIDNTLLGRGPKAKKFILYEQFKVTNILTIIDKLEKALEFPLAEMYEAQSEHSHPNAPAMILLYTTHHDGGVAHFTSRNEERGRVSMLLLMASLLSALELFKQAHEKQRLLADQFATLVELKIRERGTWPDDTEFPVKRG